LRVRNEVISDLYEQHSEPLLKLAYLIVGSNGAEDLVQEAFVRALDKWRADSPPEAFRSWAKTTMVRIAINKWRRSGREQVAFDLIGNDPDVSQPEVYPEIEVALASLTPRQRAAVALRYYEDLTEPQVADRMGIRVGTVKALLNQAREKLRLDPVLTST
jgi:RNA polymerase sigma factor (sigma-70 family)